MPITLKLNNRQYTFINRATVVMKYGHFGSGFSIDGYFDRTNSLHRELYRPLSYSEVEVFDQRGKKLITGNTLGTETNLQAVQKLAKLNGYSKSGILADCQIPVKDYPLEFNGLTLKQIADKLASSFGVTVVVENDTEGAADQVIEEVKAGNGDTVAQFLTNIAAQRNLVLSNNADGQLVITKANVSVPPIATFREELPVTNIQLKTNGQAIHSELTALKQTDIENDNASESTVTNPLVGLFRPLTKIQNVGNDNTVEDAAKRIRSKELRNIVLTIKTDRWEWLNNGTPETMTPNNIVAVISPENQIYEKTNFFVEEVKLFQTPEKETSELTCVLPEVYTGEEPKISFG